MPPTLTPPSDAPPPGPLRRWVREWLTLRKPGPLWESLLLGVSCVAFCFAAWWLLTLGEGEQRAIGPMTLPSPSETFARLPEMFGEPFNIVANTLVTLRRVALGFLLAIVIGVPLGILAGCFPRFNAFLSPLVMFGRNIPLAAVLPLLVFLASGEKKTVLFIFVACVAFIVADTAQAITDVATRYIDTAYTLGANRWQTIMKVLVPLAMPAVFGSFRVLFGLAFGYIMLAESIRNPGDVGGLGFQINTFQRRQLREHIYLIILLIPLVALAVDTLLYWIQRQLFPHVYGGSGWLAHGNRLLLHGWEDFKRIFFTYGPPPAATASAATPPVADATISHTTSTEPTTSQKSSP